MVPSLQFLGAWQFLVDFSKVWSSISCHLEGWLDWVCVSLITGIQQQKGKALDCDTRWWLQIFVYVHPYQIGGDLIWRSYFFQLVEVQPPIIRFNRINFRISKDIYIYKIWRQETTKWREQTLNFVVFTPWWTEQSCDPFLAVRDRWGKRTWCVWDLVDLDGFGHTRKGKDGRWNLNF